MSGRHLLHLSTLILFLATPAVAGPVFSDGFDDLADGAMFSTRTVGPVTVDFLDPTGTIPRQWDVFTYGSPTQAFSGAGADTPLNPGNVSFDRFIHPEGGGTSFSNAPYIITFSEPLERFGLTTIDMFENGTNEATLEAFDENGNSLDTFTINSDQGGSGIDVDWEVSALGPNFITRVEFDGTHSTGFGIDDFVLELAPPPPEIPEPTTIVLFSLALAGLAVWSRRRLSVSA